RRGLGNGSTLGIKEFSNNEIEIIRNDKEIREDTDLLIRWRCTSQLPIKKTLNKVEAIKAVNNKFTSRKLMQDAGVSVPKLFENRNDVKFPCIVRPHFHSQGKELYNPANQFELGHCIDYFHKKDKDIYVSEYIKKDKEFGVFIFDN